ncbi:DUF2059 domain-containing protein [Lichenibacterium ramalinae]|uniref:DUF2059 domain-containing protein n=1 Tax=Lichenibacterium ramalinae TaxID=2316527 RepID=A0A4Q2RJB7_9HYPH|nr:DUF2059 domain-containing protein [Lichenibacterium ramalinae]RYB07155.1 DUF2059 domain-containing protein [Lichenibacterium ramalinae]
MKLAPRLAAASLLLALAVVPASAQTPPAAGAPTAPSAAPATPAAPVPSLPQPDVPPEKLAIARQVVLGSGMGRSFEPMVPQLEEQIPAVVTRTRPELTKDLAGVLAQLQPEFQKKTGEMIDIAARIYARRMSDDDLKATAAFFDSPAGKKYVAAQPLMLDELVLAMQAWTQETSTYMMKRVQQEMEKKGDKF